MARRDGDDDGCVDDSPRRVFSNRLPYSTSMCKIDCYYGVAMDFCNCTLPMDRENVDPSAASWVRFCTTPAQKSCLFRANRPGRMASVRACQLRCRAKCVQTDYNPTLSYATFPSRSLRAYTEREVGNASRVALDDLVLLEISYDSATVI